MPHKHKRDKIKSTSSYNLPPSQIAYPLPATEQSSAQAKSSKRKARPINDDTPRAFTRLLGAYQPPRSGLDDGTRPSKKRGTGPSKSTSDNEISVPPTQPEVVTNAPIRQHNESLSSFAARVDAALPFSGIQKKSGTIKGIDKGRQTRTERKMQKMYQEWREEDKRMRDKAEANATAAEDDDNEEVVKAMGVIEGSSRRKGKKGKRKRRGGGDESSGDENPWAKIGAKGKEAEGSGGLVGLHDVVQAPPRLTRVPKEVGYFKVGHGGLKRQVELNQERRSVVEGYRKMMKDKTAHGS